MAPSEAEAHGYKRTSKYPKSTKYGRQNPISARWNSDEQLVLWRAAWADTVNLQLERTGMDERIDHRSHADRGLDQQEQRYATLLNDALTQYANLKEQAADLSPVALYEARQALRLEKEREAVQQLQIAFVVLQAVSCNHIVLIVFYKKLLGDAYRLIIIGFHASPCHAMTAETAPIRSSAATTLSSVWKPAAKLSENMIWALGPNSSSAAQTQICIR